MIMASSETLDSIKQNLTTFFENNPEAELKAGPDGPAIAKPWGDSTVEILLSGDDSELLACLNSVRLPPRFSAIVHLDSNDVEFIWTTFPVEEEIRGRSFEFRFCGNSLACRFGDASERLLAIARAFRPMGAVNETAYRNLRDLSFYFRLRKIAAEQEPKARVSPTSFWIHVGEWDEAQMVELTRNLNFFTYYFDRRSPRVVIHEDSSSRVKSKEPILFPSAAFPSVINGQVLEPYLLGLWETAVSSDPFKRYLYSYQILEYAAFYYLREECVEQIRRLLVSPEIYSRVGEAAEQVLEIVAGERASDEAKVTTVVSKLVDPEVIWRELEPNLETFSQETVFDGGFKLPALLREGWNLDDFKSMWIPKFPDCLRRLRNALVHSRESRMVGVIAPARSNIGKLRPWLGPISMAAMQVIMFRQGR